MPRIPRHFHFIFGLRPQTEPFHLAHYLCIESCLRVNKPDRVTLYHHYTPHGRYWNLVKDRIELVQVPLVERVSAQSYDSGLIGSHLRYAHHADFIRIEKLVEHGGVYADIDTLFVRPVPDALFEKNFVIGREDPVADPATGETVPSLCNAFLMAEPGAAFARLWLERMPAALDGSWSNHSCGLAARLAEERPDLLHVEPPATFYPFMWTRDDLHGLLEESRPWPAGALSVHLWAHLWWDASRKDFSEFHGDRLTEDYVRKADTTYALAARPFLPPPPAHPPRAPRGRVESPGIFPRALANPVRLSGTVDVSPDGPPPVVRALLGRRVVYCRARSIGPVGDDAGFERHRFEADLFTGGGPKFLRFQIQTGSGSWRTFARRLVHVRPARETIPYRTWIEESRELYPPEPPPSGGRRLRETIASVRAQTYVRWELCVVLAGPRDADSERFLAALASEEPRLRWKSLGVAAPAEAAAAALGQASGRLVAFLAAGDQLAPEALAEIARALALHPGAKIIYSDEDDLDPQGHRVNPRFKPAWNPELLEAGELFGRLTAYDAALVRELGGLRGEHGEVGPWDLALRAASRVDDPAIVHVPRVLYHCRGRAVMPRKAARRCLRDHLSQTRAHAEIVDDEGGGLRVRHLLPSPAPKVTIIIPTRDRLDLLRPCVTSLLARTDYPDYEVLVIDNGSSEPATLAYLRELETSGRARVLRDDGPFNYSALNNRAVAQARGSVLAFVNNDIEPITPGWLCEMTALALRPRAGAVGALLYYPDGRVQHAGVILGLTGAEPPGVAGHSFFKQAPDQPGYLNRLRVAQNYAAVTAACLVVRREVFLGVGGFDEVNLPVNYNDVDLCLRLAESSLRNVWTPHARLWHHESASRGADDTPEKNARFQREAAHMRARWGRLLADDPAYNPNLSLRHGDFRIAIPPRPPAPARVAVYKGPPPHIK